MSFGFRGRRSLHLRREERGIGFCKVLYRVFGGGKIRFIFKSNLKNRKKN